MGFQPSLSVNETLVVGSFEKQVLQIRDFIKEELNGEVEVADEYLESGSSLQGNDGHHLVHMSDF